MLCLGRKTDERIFLKTPTGEEIIIMVTGISTKGRGYVKLGITAPKSIKIIREEIKED